MKTTVIIEDKIINKTTTLSKGKVEEYLSNLSEMSPMNLHTLIEECSTQVGIRYITKLLLQSVDYCRVKTFEQGTTITEEFDGREDALELVEYLLEDEGYTTESVHYDNLDATYTLSKRVYTSKKDIETSIEVLDSVLMTKLENAKLRDNLIPFKTAI